MDPNVIQPSSEPQNNIPQGSDPNQQSHPFNPEPPLADPTPAAAPEVATSSDPTILPAPSQSEPIAQPTPLASQQAPETPVMPTASTFNPPVSSIPALSPAGMPAPVTPDLFTNVDTNPLGSKKANSVRMLVIGAGVVVFAILAVVGYVLVVNKPITITDINTANKEASALENDLTNANIGISDVTSTTTTKSLSSDITNLNSAIADAQKQYAMLKKSPVLHDANTKDKFKAFENKWPAFYTYLQGTSSDYKTLGPIVTQFTNSLQNLSANPPATIAQLQTYLANFKSIVAVAASQIKPLKMKITTDQQTITTLNTYLKSITSDISSAQSALSANNLDTVTTDLDQVSTAETTYDTSIQSISKTAENQQTSLDPTNQLNSFTDALSTLAGKTKS